jgi:hypothetical protein
VCPDSPPSGCCAIEGLACAYPTESCICDGGAWTCLACPTMQPTGWVDNHDDERLFWSCRYGNVTCTSPAGTTTFTYGTAWGCGVCPPAEPTQRSACGNVNFECSYGADTCRCSGGNAGTWTCAAPSCVPLNGADLGEHACAGPGHYTCQYPAFGENCTCGTLNDARRCSCPATRPVAGQPCLAFAGMHGKEGPCTYGDTDCSCLGAGWTCASNVPVCPTAMPPSGATCSGFLNCNYGSSLCVCDGTSWSCS